MKFIMEEAWLSGPIKGIQPILMPAAHALLQAARDIENVIPDLTTEKIWLRINGAPSVGFQMLHITGSIDRLLTYSRAESLTSAQFDDLAAENQVNESLNLQTLKEITIKKIHEAISVIKNTPETDLFERRTVGRKALPTNVFGLLFHIAEHTQRHVGQSITTAKIVNQSS